MTKEIKKVGVVGAGVIGGGMAAHLANAGIDVVLIDLQKETADKTVKNLRDLAATRTQKGGKTDPFADNLMVPENAKHITTGSVEHDLDMLKDCDMVIDAALMPDHIRQKSYKLWDEHARDDAIFVSTTSAVTTDRLLEGQSDSFKERFAIFHPFGPVKYMHGLELIAGPQTKPEVMETLQDFGSRKFGKRTIQTKDEICFIVNRLATYMAERGQYEAVQKNAKIEDVDAIFAKAFGFQAMGLFKLADQVGLPVMKHVREEMHEYLPEDDEYNQIFNGLEGINTLIDNGYVGTRGVYKKDGEVHETKGGYYRVKTDENGQVIKDAKGKPKKETLDLKTGEYRDFEESPFFKFEKTTKKLGYRGFFDFNNASLSQKFLRAAADNYNEMAKSVNKSLGGKKLLPETKGPSNAQIAQASEFTWPVMRDMMLYTLNHAQEIAFSIQDIDDAMRAGLGWQYGPFQLMDKFGVEWFAKKLESEGKDVPEILEKARKEGSFYRTTDKQNQVMDFDGKYAAMKREEGVIALEDIKVASKPLVTHNSASLWDIGDGVVALEFHSTKNAIDPSIFWVINESIKLVEANPDKYKAMVLYNDAPSFSFGANLKLVEVFMNTSENKLANMFGIGGYVRDKLPGFVEEMVYQGQAIYNALNQAPFPVIGAAKGTPQNFAFGGGCESLMHCDARQFGPEQIIGLPEAGLGLVPAWGGSVRYLHNAEQRPGQMQGPLPAVKEAMMALSNPMASIATCSQDARNKLWLNKDDRISMNPDRVLADAKSFGLEMAAAGYKPKPLPSFKLPGESGKIAIRTFVQQLYQQGGDPKKGGVNHVDVKTADALADILSGGTTIRREDVKHQIADPAVAERLAQIMDERGESSMPVNHTVPTSASYGLHLERKNFIQRFQDKATWKRVRHTLSRGAPLREDRLENEPDFKDIVDSVKQIDLNYRHIDGKPLSGEDAKRLKAMADMTTGFYALMGQKSPFGLARQVPKTLSQTHHVLDMF